MSAPGLPLLLALLLSGCSLVGSDPARADVEVYLPPTLVNAEVAVDLDGRAVRLYPLPTTGTSPVASATVDRISPGERAVSCTVATDAASATVVLKLPVAEAWEYSLTCAIQAADPADGCFGCGFSASAEVDPAFGLDADHKLWLGYGGGPIDRSILY